MKTSLAVAGVCVWMASCARPPLPGPKIDPALAMFVPPDTVLMAGVRLEAIEKTGVYKKYLAQRDFPPIDAFAKQTGVDPRKDLWELLYISNGKRSALLGHGMFSDEAEPRLQSGGNRFAYKGVTMVGDERSAILLVSQTVLAAGDTAELRALVDAREKGAGAPPAMAALLKNIPLTSQIWTAYNGGPVTLPFDLSGNLANVNNIAQSVQSGTLYLDLTSGITGQADGNCTSEQSAQQVEGGLKAMIGLGRLSTPSNQPDLQRTWDGLRVTQQQSNVKLHVDEPEELVEKSLNQWLGRVTAPK